MTWRNRIGSLPAVAVVGGMYVVALLALALPRSTAETVWLACPLLVLGYCLLRRDRGNDIFWTAMSPGPISWLANLVFGVSRPLVGVPLALLSLFVIAFTEREGAAA